MGIWQNVFKALQWKGNVITAAVYDAPCIFYTNKYFVSTDLLWLTAVHLMLKASVFSWQKQHRGASLVWSTPVRKNTAYKLGLINPASSIFLTRRQFDIKISTTNSQSQPTKTHRWEKTAGKPALRQFSKCVWWLGRRAKPQICEVRNRIEHESKV